MKDIIGKIHDSRKQDLEILVDGITTKNLEKIVNTFNDYFYFYFYLNWRVVLKVMSIQYHIYQRILRKVYLFLISLNMKLQLNYKVLIIVAQVGITSHQ